MKNTNKPRTKNSAWENIDLFIQKKLEADSRLIDYQRARERTRTETKTRKWVSKYQNSDHNIENLISEEAPKKKKIKIKMKAMITLTTIMIMTVMITMIIIMCH